MSDSNITGLVARTFITVGAALLLAACASPAGNTSGQASAGTADERRVAATDEKDSADGRSPDDVICESRHVIGSRLPQRTCRTRAEWDASRQSARETMRDLGSVPTVVEDE